jgi:diguanylate cyclase (GGDEF)-like protein
MQLNIPTLLICTLSGYALLAVQLTLSQRKDVPAPELRIWVRAAWMLLAGIALLVARGPVPLEISALGGNTLVAAAVLLNGDATARFVRQRGLSRRWWFGLALFSLTLAILLPYSTASRAFVVSIGLAVFSLPLTVLTLRTRGLKERSLTIMGVAGCVYVVTMLARAVHIVVAPETYTDGSTGDFILALQHLIGFLAMMACGFGFVLANFERAALRMAYQAQHDALTGCLNRASTQDLLAHLLAHGARTKQPFSCALLDLDHFKSINDTYGHPAGDAVLQGFVDTVKARLRASDALGRIGGEEFLLLLPNTDAPGAEQLLDDLRARVAARRFELPSDGTALPRQVTFSGGLIEVRAGARQRPSAQQLYAAADQALYEAKGAGRNRVVLAPAAALTPEETASSRQRVDSSGHGNPDPMGFLQGKQISQPSC